MHIDNELQSAPAFVTNPVDGIKFHVKGGISSCIGYIICLDLGFTTLVAPRVIEDICILRGHGIERLAAARRHGYVIEF